MRTCLTANLLVPAWIVSAGVVGAIYPPPSVPAALVSLLLTIVVVPCVGLTLDLLVRRRFAAAGTLAAAPATERQFLPRDAQG